MSPQMIAAGVSAIGSLIGGVGAWQAGKARAAALKAAAKQERRDAAIEASLAADEAERAAAAGAVRGAANGGGFSGSFAAVLEDLERRGRFNVRSAIHAGEVSALNREYEARVAKAEGRMALIGSVFPAGGSLLGAHMQAGQKARQQAARQKLYVMGGG